MTAPMTYRAWAEQMAHSASEIRRSAGFPDRINAMLRPLVVAVGIITAGATSLPMAHADPPPGGPPNNIGFGNNGPTSNALAGMGQSICPMLVQPGATVASIASQLSGSTGLPPGLVGLAASMAIQMGCPGFMNSLANGQIPGPLQGPLQGLAGNPGSPSPFQLPGANPGQGVPLSPPGANPAPGVPPSLRGTGPAVPAAATSELRMPFM